MSSQIKTNVSRLLDKAGVEYQMHSYQSDGPVDGMTVAAHLGVEPRRVFKTLVTKGTDGAYRVFVLPCDHELDLKAAARAAGVKGVELVPVNDLLKITGYIRGGCSPLGMRRHYPTFIDQSCKSLEKVIVSAGKIGFQVELGVETLLALSEAQAAALTAN